MPPTPTQRTPISPTLNASDLRMPSRRPHFDGGRLDPPRESADLAVHALELTAAVMDSAKALPCFSVSPSASCANITSV